MVLQNCMFGEPKPVALAVRIDEFKHDAADFLLWGLRKCARFWLCRGALLLLVLLLLLLHGWW